MSKTLKDCCVFIADRIKKNSGKEYTPEELFEILMPGNSDASRLQDAYMQAQIAEKIEEHGYTEEEMNKDLDLYFDIHSDGLPEEWFLDNVISHE